MSDAYDDSAYEIEAYEPCSYLLDFTIDCGDFWFENKEFTLCIGRIVRFTLKLRS